jgi:hypothetical protein
MAVPDTLRWRRVRFAVRPQEGEPGMTVHVEWETDGQRMERCDHEGTTGPLDGLESVSTCRECGKMWPTRFGAGAPTVRIVPKREGPPAKGTGGP